MKVAMVSEHASPLAILGGVDAGGQNVHVAEVAAALARRGDQVDVFTRRDSPDLPGVVRTAEGVQVVQVAAGPPREVSKDDLLPYMDDFGAVLSRSWATDRPDLVHAHFWMSGTAALAAAVPLGLPVLETFHALGVVKRRQQGMRDPSPPERVAIEGAVARGVDQIIATSSDEVFELAGLGVDMRRVSVVPCGVDPRHFTPEGPAMPRRTGYARLALVSRLVERKGIGNAITAMCELPGAELVIAGGPPAERLGQDPQARRLTALADRLGVADRVHLIGRIGRDQVPALLRSADVVVCPPWYEPFGMVALEAMACGVPVVASAVGGLVDTVVDGVTGLHVPPRQPQALAAALASLLADPRRRAAFGRVAVLRARQRYSWDRVAAATVDAYSRTLARRRAAAGGVTVAGTRWHS
jgi:glycosyltransferase involved in cell wall biosynthesis